MSKGGKEERRLLFLGRKKSESMLAFILFKGACESLKNEICIPESEDLISLGKAYQASILTSLEGIEILERLVKQFTYVSILKSGIVDFDVLSEKYPADGIAVNRLLRIGSNLGMAGEISKTVRLLKDYGWLDPVGKKNVLHLSLSKARILFDEPERALVINTFEEKNLLIIQLVIQQFCLDV